MEPPSKTGRGRLRLAVAALGALALVVGTSVAILPIEQDDAGTRHQASPSARAETSKPNRPDDSEPEPERSSHEGDGRPGIHGFPGAGVLKASVLEESESVTVREDGAVVENLFVRGTINIRADDVVIRNVRLETKTDGYPLRVYDGHRGVTIENVAIAMPTKSCSAAAIYGGRDLVVRYTKITGCGDGLKVASGSVYEYNDIRLANADGSDMHVDGMQNSGASNVVIRGNSIVVPAEDGGNAAIFTHDRFGPVEDVVIEDNLLDGGNYTLYVEGERTTGVRVTDNRFGRQYRYGLLRFRDAEVVREGNVWDDSEEPV